MVVALQGALTPSVLYKPLTEVSVARNTDPLTHIIDDSALLYGSLSV